MNITDTKKLRSLKELSRGGLSCSLALNGSTVKTYRFDFRPLLVRARTKYKETFVQRLNTQKDEIN